MTDALRCSTCGVSWPFDTTNYAKCPICLEKTDGIRNATPIPEDEALSVKRHADFERYCEDRDEKCELGQNDLDALWTDAA